MERAGTNYVAGELCKRTRGLERGGEKTAKVGRTSGSDEGTIDAITSKVLPFRDLPKEVFHLRTVKAYRERYNISGDSGSWSYDGKDTEYMNANHGMLFAETEIAEGVGIDIGFIQHLDEIFTGLKERHGRDFAISTYDQY